MHRRRYLWLIGLAGMVMLVATLPWGNHSAYGNAGPKGVTWYANSPAPDFNANIPPTTTNGSGTPIRKFLESLPGLTAAHQNTLNQYIPVATAVKTASDPTNPWPGSDYYHLSVEQFTQRLHTDLPNPTKLRGYKDVGGGQNPYFLGPLILAKRNTPVRILVDNNLGLSTDAVKNYGQMYIPVDYTVMGAGQGPNGGNEYYTQNRSAVHLHGGATPWISDGTPWQWMTPNGEPNTYQTGVSFRNVPDMPTPAQGSQTLFYTNQQSSRLMFYHDHAVGITRLNVYAGIAAPYLLWDDVENNLITAGVIPGKDEPDQIYRFGYPLIIQDRTFVPDNVLTLQDDKWTGAAAGPPGPSTVGAWGSPGGDFWFPHVYEPNQDPTVLSGANPYGRWDYGPWFWPPQPASDIVAPLPTNTTIVPESFCDTAMVNGTPYPYMEVEPRAYRFRLLNACNDRYLNLQTYYADTGNNGLAFTGTAATATATIAAGQVTGFTNLVGGSGYAVAPGVYLVGGGGSGAMAQATITGGKVTALTLTNPGSGYTSQPTVCFGGDTVVKDTEVKMVAAIFQPGFPLNWPTDGRDGGVPDPALRGPQMIQIGNEGGFLPAVANIDNQPINYVYNRRNIVVLNVSTHALYLGPAERADFLMDFTGIPVGTRIIVYNDAPAPNPGFDPRYDHYTCNVDYTSTGGAYPTRPGYGPNTRTIMQFRVVAKTSSAGGINPAVYTQLPTAFAQSQPPPIVPQSAYNAAYGRTFTDTYARIQNTSLTWTSFNGGRVTYPFQPKAIQELFDHYGRMNATLGVELPFTTILNQTTIPLGYIDPPTEIMHDGKIQLWKITHNGVDTHAIHFHLFNVQLINRVGWDGAITPPDANEQGWKETIKMNPLEDVMVAIQPRLPKVPFAVPQSIRYLAPNMAPGMTSIFFENIDANGNPVTTTNDLYNYNQEYVWHCHLLGHEENDMMRPIVMRHVAFPEIQMLLLNP